MDKIVLVVKNFVKERLKNAEGGHDWWHAYRVWKISRQIASKESSVNHLVVELGALLHDIADHKFHDGDEELGQNIAEELLTSLDVEKDDILHVKNIIANISYSTNLGKKNKFKSLELDIIQDADRLDALGAIGIARAFNYGGFKNREMHNPNIKPILNMTKEEYKKNVSPTVNHFYEKLFLLKNIMNTKMGKELAEKRDRFMQKYLNEFYGEWEGER